MHGKDHGGQIAALSMVTRGKGNGRRVADEDDNNEEEDRRRRMRRRRRCNNQSVRVSAIEGSQRPMAEAEGGQHDNGRRMTDKDDNNDNDDSHDASRDDKSKHNNQTVNGRGERMTVLAMDNKQQQQGQQQEATLGGRRMRNTLWLQWRQQRQRKPHQHQSRHNNKEQTTGVRRR